MAPTLQPPSQRPQKQTPQQGLEQQLLARFMLLVGFATQVVTIETGMSQKRIRAMRKDLKDSGYPVSMSRRTYRPKESILEDQAGKLHASLFVSIYQNIGNSTNLIDFYNVKSSISINALMRAFQLYHKILRELPTSSKITLENCLNINDAWLLARELRSGENHMPVVWQSLESELEEINKQGAFDLQETGSAHEDVLPAIPIPPPTQYKSSRTEQQETLNQHLTARFMLLSGFITHVITIETGLSQKRIRNMRQELDIVLKRRTLRTSRTIVDNQAGKLHASMFMAIYHDLGRTAEENGARSITSSINIDVLLKAYGLYSALLHEAPETDLVSWSNWLSISDAWSLAREMRANEASMFECRTCKMEYFESIHQDTLIDCPYCIGLLPSSLRVAEEMSAEVA